MFAVSDKVNDFSEFAYASVAEVSCVLIRLGSLVSGCGCKTDILG